MNKQFRELAEQASIEFTYDVTETPARAFAECWEDELEKFAELIVRQCALTAGLMEHDGRKNIGANILDIFGIQDD
jgi:hypothetical protein